MDGESKFESLSKSDRSHLISLTVVGADIYMSAYMIDKSKFVFEQFDQEMVLINLEDGLYYNVSDTGTEVLRILEQGLTVADVLDVLSAHYSNTDELPALVEGFVAELEEQGILLPLPQGAPMNSQYSAQEAARNGTKKCFTPPVLTRFDDMQEILLLDPIHQVSEQGWPNR